MFGKFLEHFRDNGDDGFSLIEIVVAVGVMLSLMTAGLYGYPHFSEWQEKKEVEIATETGYHSAVNGLVNQWDELTVEKALEYAENEYKNVSLGYFGDDTRTLCVYGSYVKNGENLHEVKRGACDGLVLDFGSDEEEYEPEQNEDEIIVEPTFNPEPTIMPIAPTSEVITESPTPPIEPSFPETIEPTMSPSTSNTKPAFSNLTKMVFTCDKNTTAKLPLDGISSGVLYLEGSDDTWVPITRSRGSSSSVTLKSGITYTMYFDGKMTSIGSGNLVQCLTNVESIGMESGLTSLSFEGAKKLVDVPPNIPSTVTGLATAFKDATLFNDPDVGSWDVSNVKTMPNMFRNASSFNQPLKDWDVSNVNTMANMFRGADSFYQDLSAWEPKSNAANPHFAPTLPKNYLPKGF